MQKTALWSGDVTRRLFACSGVTCTRFQLPFSARLNLSERAKRKILMRIKLIIALMTIACMGVFAAGFGQKITYTGNKVKLTTVFKEIKSQTGYFVVCDLNLLKDAKLISVSASDQPLNTFVAKILEGQGLDFTIEGSTIVVTRKAQSTLPSKQLEIIATPLFPIIGKITDLSGTPLGGATITVRGTRKTAISDATGTFSLDIAEGDVLIISYVGYATAVYTIKSTQEQISISLEPRPDEEMEVVVSTGYQSLPRERAAGSFGVVGKRTLEKRSNYNIQTYIEGQVPGLLMNSNGDITIRGRSTLSADRNPLVVVDGFPIERSLETINPADIESITILKDASAASIWGVRAANGVVVIQTKRGASSKKPLDINLSSTFSVMPVSDLSKMPYGSVESFIEYEKFKVENGLAFFAGSAPRPVLSPVTDAYLNNPSQADVLVESLKKNRAKDEFEDYFMRPETRQQYTVSLSGKGEKTSSRASFSYDKLNDQFKGNNSERFVADLFHTASITKSLHVEAGLNFAINNGRNNGMSLNDLRSLLPYHRILDDNGEYLSQPQTFYEADKITLEENGYPYSWSYNLMQEYENKNNKSNNSTINGVAALSYQFMKGISAHIAYQYEQGNSGTTSVFNEETYFTRNLVNYATSIKNGSPVLGIPKGGVYRENLGEFYSHTLRPQFRVDREIGSADHYLSAIGGMEIREVGSSGSSQTKYGFDEQSRQFTRVNYETRYTDVRGSLQSIPDESNFPVRLERFLSVFGNAGYTYSGRYTLNVSARLDKTNLFGTSPKYRNVWLWSAGAAWQMHKEKFFQSNFLNTLTLRATYGINGNVDRNTSPYLTATVRTESQTNRPYAAVENPQNPLLRWEKTVVTNFGADFSMLSNRLRGSLEYYNRRSEDLLGNTTVNGTYGFNSALINYATMRNSGFDVRISGVILNGNFGWTSTLNYSYNKNKVVEVDFPQKTVGSYLNSVAQAGKPLEYIYSYYWAGLTGTGAPQVYDLEKNIVDYRTDIADPNALHYQGTAVAPHYGGWINEFSYRGFNLTTNFTYKMGHRFRMPVILYQSISETNSQVYQDWDNRWKNVGDEVFTNIPAAPTSITGLDVYDKYSRYADINVATASHIRFRELILNYAIPKSLFGNLYGAGLSVGIQVRNLAVVKFNNKNLDPEYLTYDRSTLVLPPRPEYAFIIRANF